MTAELAALLIALGCNAQIAVDNAGWATAVIWVCPPPSISAPPSPPRPQPQMQRRG